MAVSQQSSTMEHRGVLLTLLLVVLLHLAAQAYGDDVKHKKVVIKVPKKIKHVHHHHVKKVHIWKHKPKPIHSVHIVEEEEPMGKEWQEAFHSTKHKIPHHGWKASKPVQEDWEEEEDQEEYEDYDGGHDEETHKKAGSHYEPVVWKGNKGGRKWKDGPSSSFKGRDNTRGRLTSYKGDRSKRQKNVGRYEERYPEEPRYSKRVPLSPPKKSKKNKGTNTKYDRKPRPNPYRPLEKGANDYWGEYEDSNKDEFAAVWPERKEHISWHLRGDSWSQPIDPPKVTETPFFNTNEFPVDHYKGEINLSNQVIPDIQIVESPKLELSQHTQKPKHYANLKGDSSKPLSTEYRKPQATEYRKPQDSEYRKLQDSEYRKPQDSEYRKPQVPQELIFSQQALDTGFRTQISHEGENLSGYTSHVGHNAEGDSASFQSVKFGDKKKPLY